MIEEAISPPQDSQFLQLYGQFKLATAQSTSRRLQVKAFQNGVPALLTASQTTSDPPIFTLTTGSSGTNANAD